MDIINSRNEILFENDYAYMLLSKDNVIKKVIFDTEDIIKLAIYKWHLHLRKSDMRYDACANSYGSHETRKYINMARYILDYDGDLTVDHINHNTLDNRKSNLRICSRFENNQNKTNNTSGCVGVVWDKSRGKWKASISGKHLGRFDTLEEAIKVRKNAEKDYL